MTDQFFSLDCGGQCINYSLLYPETRRFFGKYMKKCTAEPSGPVVSVTPAFMQENSWLVDENEKYQPFIEFQNLMLATGNVLLLHHRALFHGAAFLWRGKAWIITAPSGIGKTTQLFHWQRLLPDEICVINGDKPLLECRKDGSVWVHSSPWRGKEKFGTPDLHAPLGGILLLERSNHNVMKRLTAMEAVRPLFIEFVSWPENDAQMQGQARILRQMIDAVPIWKLVNLGDEASALLTQQTLEKYLRDGKDE